MIALKTTLNESWILYASKDQIKWWIAFTWWGASIMFYSPIFLWETGFLSTMIELCSIKDKSLKTIAAQAIILLGFFFKNALALSMWVLVNTSSITATVDVMLAKNDWYYRWYIQWCQQTIEDNK